ncbi:MAG: YbaB/EbfC family nucleoid-associated protein [Magnetococcales bacterium]|nr:YbaB/EbfC family nucleoid-associated protein [Magnetococcales bacterium]
MKNIGNMLKQAQKMQSQMAKMQEDMEAMVVTGAAGGSMVEVTINGKNQIQKVKIDPSAVDPEDVEMLEDLIVAAMNDAQRKVNEANQEQMAALTGGMNIPGLKMPF